MGNQSMSQSPPCSLGLKRCPWLSLQLHVSLQLLPWAAAAAGTRGWAATQAEQFTIHQRWNTPPLPRRLFLSEAAKGYYWLESHSLWARGKYSLEQWNKQMTIKCIICYIGICCNISQSNVLLHTSSVWGISSHSCTFMRYRTTVLQKGKREKKKAFFKLMKWWNACVVYTLNNSPFFPHCIICLSI